MVAGRNVLLIMELDYCMQSIDQIINYYSYKYFIIILFQIRLWGSVLESITR